MININDFTISTRKDSIFYGDIFKIGGEGCLFFGSGKTKAGRSAIENEDDEICLDLACLTRDSDTTYGHFEMEFYSNKIPDPIEKKAELNRIIRFLDEEETRQIFQGKELCVQETNYQAIVQASAFNILFMPLVPVTNEERMNKFISLTKDSSIRSFLIVPWMDSHEEKGKMLKNYILGIKN